jgi:hypothetical protein
MSKRTHIREFLSFQSKRNGDQSINETVIQREKSFLVNGIEIERKVINKYASNVKSQLEKDIKTTFSEEQLAEELVKWAIQSLGDGADIPVTAVLDGDVEMASGLNDEEDSEIDETGDLDIEETDEDENIDTEGSEESEESDEDTEGDEDFDVNFDDDDFESPEGEESDEDTEGDEEDTDIDVEEADEEGDEDTDTEETDEDDEDQDLPI